MTDRIPLDHLTSDQYDELCDRLEHAESELRDWAERDSADAAAGSYALRAEHVEATIARVQALADRWVKAGPPPLGTSMARWWDMRLAELNTALDQPGPAATQAAGHVYLSTGCYHGDHAYCQAMTGLNGAKRPASCKFCQASCRCDCHATTKEN